MLTKVPNIELYIKGWPLGGTIKHTHLKEPHDGKKQAVIGDSNRAYLLLPEHHPRATFFMCLFT